MNALKNYGIVEGKDLEDTRELTERKGTDRWTGWPIGGSGRPHKSSSHGGFSHVGF